MCSIYNFNYKLYLNTCVCLCNALCIIIILQNFFINDTRRTHGAAISPKSSNAFACGVYRMRAPSVVYKKFLLYLHSQIFTLARVLDSLAVKARIFCDHFIVDFIIFFSVQLSVTHLTKMFEMKSISHNTAYFFSMFLISRARSTLLLL